MSKMAFPDHPDHYLKLCNKGYTDALRFLLRKSKCFFKFLFKPFSE